MSRKSPSRNSEAGPEGEPSVGMHRRRLGQAGERAAEEWYRSRGFDLVERNWRCARGEIDLILRKKQLLVVCEVKTRASDAFGIPAEAVSVAKQRRIRGLASLFLEESDLTHAAVRFDVACVMGTGIEIIEDAF